MLNTNIEKLVLLQWFFRNNDRAFRDALKVQKFLFFYEIFSKIQDKTYSLEWLTVYENGPVFTPTIGDYRYQYDDLVAKLSGADLADHNFVLDITTARKANFLVSIMNKADLSELTHQFDIWKKKSGLLAQGMQQIRADENDFSEADWKLAELLFNAYSIDLIESSNILYLDPLKFVIKKDDERRLTDSHRETLDEIAMNPDGLENPVFVSLAEDGVLEID